MTDIATTDREIQDTDSERKTAAAAGVKGGAAQKGRSAVRERRFTMKKRRFRICLALAAAAGTLSLAGCGGDTAECGDGAGNL